jgi:large subunit ribosomal protein L10
MNRDQKTAVVEEIAGQIQEAEAIFAVDYRGITVAQVADLRARLRESDARFRVVKNSLSERAADRAGMESLKPMLVGPTALTLVNGDAALAAKALADAARTLHLLDFKGGVLNGSVLSADDVRSIARLPSRDVLTGQLVGTIAAPLSGLVRTLNALIAGVAIQLQAIADQGLVSGTPAAPAPGDAAEAAAEEQAAAVEGEVSPEPPAEPVGPEPDTPEAEAETARAAEVPHTEPGPETETETQAAPDAPSSDA